MNATCHPERKSKARGLCAHCVAKIAYKEKRWKRWDPESQRRANLKRNYGITPEDYERMLAEQGGGCYICGQETGTNTSRYDKATRLHVDHNHETGQVRGLLCYNCNRGLGMFKDDPKLLTVALKYLKKFGSL